MNKLLLWIEKITPKKVNWTMYGSVAVFALSLSWLTSSIAYVNLTYLGPNKKVSHSPTPKTKPNKNVDPLIAISGPLFNDFVPTPTKITPEKTIEPDRPFELIGTLSGSPSYARAVIRVLDNKDPVKEYKTWQKIGNIKITYIGREYIWIEKNGQKIKLKTGETTQQAIADAQKVATETSSVSNTNITKIISREEVNQYFNGKEGSLYKGLSVGPDVKNGIIKGYKLKKVASSHILYKLGARSGDIVRQINGLPLNSSERMFELWKVAKTTDRFKIKIERSGKILNFDLNVRN